MSAISSFTYLCFVAAALLAVLAFAILGPSSFTLCSAPLSTHPSQGTSPRCSCSSSSPIMSTPTFSVVPPNPTTPKGDVSALPVEPMKVDFFFPNTRKKWLNPPPPKNEK
jgi:hypothetical protein